MANSTIVTQTVTPPGTDLDAELLAGAGPAGQDIWRERIQITGAVLAEIARVVAAFPAITDFGLVTRSIPERATTGTPVGIVVSTVAILLAASNTSRKSILISNNGSGAFSIFLGSTAAVTTGGATMGIKVTAGGVYSDSGEDCYTGDIYAIGSAVSVAANVSRWERT